MFQLGVMLSGMSQGKRFGERVRPCRSAAWYVFIRCYHGDVDFNRTDNIPEELFSLRSDRSKPALVALASGLCLTGSDWLLTEM